MAEIKVATYLFERLKELGIKSIFGVPGDYELALLDFIPLAGLTWRGNPNELNAGYAADGYARVNGAGAVVTTFGPGELSNLCPIAGSYTEFVPVVHIVGYPTEAAQQGPNIMHHSLGEVGTGKFDVFHKMSSQITCANTVLHDKKTAPAEIDRVLNAMLHYSQPVYIGIPVDIAVKTTSSASLKTPLVTSLPANDPALQAKVVTEILQLVEAAKRPVIIVDGGIVRNRLTAEARTLVEVTGFLYFTTAMGKGGISEQYPSYGGIYGGGASSDSAIEAINGSDCILWLGNYPSDFNTGEFTEFYSRDAVIDFQRFFIKVGQYTKYDIHMKYVLDDLIDALSSKPIPSSFKVTWKPYGDGLLPASPVLTQDYLWASLGPYFRNGDCIIAETGTSAFGIPGTSLQHLTDCTIYSQTVFGSIGFAAGAAVGSFVANKERGSGGRNILITGEGSLQLTVQAFSDLLRHEVNPTIFLLNNDGYTIERLIHGMEAEYNTVPVWDYGKLFAAFGPGSKTVHHLVKTPGELDALLKNDEFCAAKYPQIVELILHRHDAPASVVKFSRLVGAFNAREG